MVHVWDFQPLHNSKSMCTAGKYLVHVWVVDFPKDGDLCPEVPQRNLIRAPEHLGSHLSNVAAQVHTTMNNFAVPLGALSSE
mgnify:CR=1 FL=1